MLACQHPIVEIETSASLAGGDVTESPASQIADLNREVLKLKQEINSLKAQLTLAKRFSYANIANQPDVVVHYIGLSSDEFDVLTNTAQQLQPFRYYLGWDVVSLEYIADQILMTLMKLKRNYSLQNSGFLKFVG